MKNCALVFLLCLGLSLPARAEVARVDSGEHGSFTRIVVEASDSSGWKVGRSVDGYELEMPSQVTGYDLREAFRKIPKNRIVALWQDPQSRRLRFSLSCACHVIAFEFRPGTVVLDIQNGPAPNGSSFENELPVTAAETGESNTNLTASAAYDWVARESSVETKAKTPPLSLPTGDVSLVPLRNALLGEISKGVAAGVVDIAEGAKRPNRHESTLPENSWARISQGELPGLTVGGEEREKGRITSDGHQCLPDEDIDVPAWGQGDKFAAEIGLARTGMVGEFDTPSKDAVLRSVRFHLFIGFGAEARQYLGFLQASSSPETDPLLALSHILDGEVPVEDPFLGMEVCEGPVALWAVLALPPKMAVPPGTNKDAVVRSFSALPPHLRRHMGGDLVDRFLASGDRETASKLRDSILRLPGKYPPEVALMDARYQLANGEDARAAELATGILLDSGLETPIAAATLVEAAFHGDQRLDPKLPPYLDAALRDARGTDLEDQLLRATVLAHGMSGDFAAATAYAARNPETLTDLWSLLVKTADDDAFLTAVANQANPLLSIRPEVAELVARRLLDLGFGNLAQAWISPIDTAVSPETRLLAAEAKLAVGDAAAVQHILAGQESAESARLLGLAAVQLGNLPTAAEELKKAGEVDAGLRAVTWTQDWSYIKSSGPENWKAAVGSLVIANNTSPDDAGTISSGKRLVEESEQTRRLLNTLLSESSVSRSNQ